MYAFIKGELFFANSSYAIISANGVGYKIFIPSNVFGKLPSIGKDVILYTCYVVREHSQALYGFLNAYEGDLFDLLNDVTGIGPKLALSMISSLTIVELHKAIQNKDVQILNKIPGVGKKTAERIVIELRDKFTHLLPLDLASLVVDMPDLKNQKIQDAMSALINLGYNQSTAQNALKKTLKESSEELDIGLLITRSLQNLK